MMDIVQEIISILKERQLCRTVRSFATEWAGVDESYFRIRKHEGRTPTLAVMFTIFVNLRDAGQHDLAMIVMSLMVDEVVNRGHRRSKMVSPLNISGDVQNDYTQKEEETCHTDILVG